MPPNAPSFDSASFFDLTLTEATDVVVSAGLPAFRANQLFEWVYQKLQIDPAKMSNLPQALRASIGETFSFNLATAIARQLSNDGTLKLLLGWESGRQAETVMIPDGDRRTACISSQFGCPVGCRFCASGVNGVQGNLSAGQIVEQIFALNAELAARGEHVSNIVFMGMGEPLANYGAVVKAIRILHEPRGFDVGCRRITVSTVGVPSKIRALADEGMPVNLAFSLHAPNEALRRKLIPWAEHFELDEILQSLRYYFEQTGREITLEYILLGEVNDQPEHARQLARLCQTLRANVNLIRYNEVEGLPYKRPAATQVVRFQEILRHAGVNAHVRKSRGRDIDAACGQLRKRHIEPDADKALALPILAVDDEHI